MTDTLDKSTGLESPAAQVHMQPATVATAVKAVAPLGASRWAAVAGLLAVVSAPAGAFVASMVPSLWWVGPVVAGVLGLGSAVAAQLARKKFDAGQLVDVVVAVAGTVIAAKGATGKPPEEPQAGGVKIAGHEGPHS